MRGREFIVEGRQVTVLFFSHSEFSWIVYESTELDDGVDDLELVGVFVREHKIRSAMKQYIKETVEFYFARDPDHFDEDVLSRINENLERFFKTEKTNLI